MKAKIITILLAIFFCSQSFSESAYSIEDFKSAYASYNEYAEKNKWKQSIVYAKKSYEIGLELFGEASKNTANLAYNYGVNLKEIQEKDEAAKILTKAVKIYEKAYGKEAKELIQVLIDLGHVVAKPYVQTKQISYYERALDLAEKYYGKDSLQYGYFSIDMGVVLSLETTSTRAKHYLETGYAIVSEKQGDKSTKAAWAAFNLGKYELATRDYKEAIVYFNKALSTFELSDQPSNQMELTTHGFLVEAYEKLEQHEEATQHCVAIGQMTPFTDRQKYLPLVKVAPSYPGSAAEKRREGYVIVEYDVDEAGFVKNPVVIDESGPNAFSRVSLEAV